MELERSFNTQRTRAGVAFWVNRRVNPFYELPDNRQQVRFEADHALMSWMRVGVGARIAQVEFGDGYAARHTAVGPHVTFDTRINPLYPRNAIHAEIGWERMAFESGDAGRWTTDARGYIGVAPRTILVLRGRLRVRTPLNVHELETGQAVLLDPDIPHDVEAPVESDMLLAVHLLEPR